MRAQLCLACFFFCHLYSIQLGLVFSTSGSMIFYREIQKQSANAASRISWRHCRIYPLMYYAIPPTYFCLQFPNFWAADSSKMTCLIPSSEVQCRQSEAWKTLPIPVGKRRWQGLGSVSDHRTYHTPLRTTRKQHGQRGPKMKWSRAETAKNGRKYSEKVSGAGSHP